ncbi:hypothetical protein QOZ80_6AG0510260 [Eleusine coracana subsp. coracana]|nr:hypothetical protein QOZ80_6AG0510260 [Eleusine coracana subsp. coracana]
MALELFPDGEHVRLQSRDRRGMYLHADEDAVGVSLSPVRASLSAVWQVLHVQRGGVTFVLLHNAAYGRYLKATEHAAPRGHLGKRVVQGVYNEEQDEADLCWTPARVAEGSDKILLRHISHRLLRGNGKYCWWRTGVSVGDYLDPDTMAQWVVESVPRRRSSLHLPLPQDEHERPQILWDRILCIPPPVALQRTIRFVQAANDGTFDPNGWTEIQFQGRSVFNVRRAVARIIAEDVTTDIKLCMRAGNLGPLFPLGADLPRNQDPIDIIVLSFWAPGSFYSCE